MRSLKIEILIGIFICATLTSVSGQQGTVVTEHINSIELSENLVGIDLNRTVKVYLPPGYATSGSSYPVLYYCHNLNFNAEQLFADGNLVKLLERGFANGVVKEFILVAATYGTPTSVSWYENSPTTGRWIDFTVKELVPFIDNRFRTIRNRDSRAVAGDFVGGRGALLFAMLYPDLFSVTYALHPVATGVGSTPMAWKTDWNKIHNAKELKELDGVDFARPFVSISQAFLPNPNRPPFYCDFMVEMENGKPVLNIQNSEKLKTGFLLDHMLGTRAENLRKMRAIGFDWGRYDPNQDHVVSNQSFTRKLDELGIEHQAEEYRGDPWSKNWTENGRFYTRLLPFIAKNMVFETNQ
ncbi:alpha/beta hydrolase [Dyadobacter pollutisoli]|uniref:Alpha/beta hydrolase-fold protein n=1 Tax=Dyadobacter pollutisoli TaxID=2910158 RepID=A0A9E8NDJ0_9BACT|nr:alpha/beta hydrolase-fold protein [Dyadobacter pollutisoli]WAC14749.1 alpha/beta hydrolase-fold protein [Dyadobacter pollutisoli]